MAGASAADVRSILSLPGPSTPGPSIPRIPSTSAPTKSTRKPEGISRELYSLIGPSAPSLTAQFIKPRLKPKPNFGGGSRASKWEWASFSNPVRADGLVLNHWVKAGTQTSDYPFAKYNVPSSVYTYSQDEYDRLLQDGDWTREETDYLFNLVKEYDMRFYVIADRYEYPGGNPRTLEDLKDRYYSVCRRLIRNRPWAGDDNSKAQLLQSFMFDKEREMTRKKYIASLENRTPEQIAEEEALYIEIKRLEQNERRFAKEREELLRVIGGIESGLASVAAEDDASAVMFSDPKKRRRGTGLESESPASATPGVIAIGTPQTPSTRKAQSAKSAAYDLQHCIHRTEVPSGSSMKITHLPVYLRSWKLPTPKPSNAAKITQALTELGINYSRLVMPTRENVDQLQALYEAANALVDTKKVVDRVEQEIRVLQEKKSGRGSVSRSDTMDIDADAEADADVDAEAEADETETKNEPEEEMGEEVVNEDNVRAHSVATSTRSALRRRSGRSNSISSVDTAATTATSTRASRKRQRT